LEAEVPVSTVENRFGNWRSVLRSLFVLMIILNGLDGFRDPQPKTQSVVLFRALVPCVGLAGLLVLWLLDRFKKPKDSVPPKA